MTLLKEYAALTDSRLEELLAPRKPELLFDSMAYSVRAGGKRLRPALLLMANAMGGGDRAEALDYACAIEMIHTSSLIHDDLPAIDNDCLRRGRPTNHVVYGEAQAVIAGDALLNYAYEVMLGAAARYPGHSAAHIRAMSRIARGAGVGGMMAGQVQDVALEGTDFDYEELKYIHRHKTGDMITGALLAGLELTDPSPDALEALTLYGEQLGLVFQIVDDILDVTAGEELGKTTGKDAAAGKVTYPALFGLEKSRELAREGTEKAIDALAFFGEGARPLQEIAGMMLARNK